MRSFLTLVLLLVLTPAMALAAGPAQIPTTEPDPSTSCGDEAPEQVDGAAGE